MRKFHITLVFNMPEEDVGFAWLLLEKILQRCKLSSLSFWSVLLDKWALSVEAIGPFFLWDFWTDISSNWWGFLRIIEAQIVSATDQCFPVIPWPKIVWEIDQQKAVLFSSQSALSNRWYLCLQSNQRKPGQICHIVGSPQLTIIHPF